MSIRRISLSAAVWSLFFGALCLAQSGAGVSYPDTAPQRGVSPVGAYDFDKLETINKANGNLTYTIPLTSMPLGRGGMTLPINLTYNSTQYDYQYSYTYGAQSPNPAFLYQSLVVDPNAGWSISPNYWLYIETTPPATNGLNGGNNCSTNIGVVRSSLVMPDGSRHVLYFPGFPQGFTGSGDGFFPWDFTGATKCTEYSSLTGNVRLFTADSSYITLVYSTSTGIWTATLPNGTTISSPHAGGSPETITDRSGNKISIANSTSGSNYYTTLTDDFSRTVQINHNLTTGGWVVTQAGYQGAPLTWTLANNSSGATTFSFPYTCQNTQTIAGQTVYYKTCPETGYGGGSSTLQAPSNDPATPLVYTFQYGPQSGLLKTVVLPSGASTTYTYQCENYPSCFNLRTDLLNPVIGKTLTWTDFSDGGSAQRTETWGYGGSGYSYGTNFAKTNPDNGTETTYMGGPSMPLPTRVVEPNGDSVDTYYQFNRPYGLSGGAPNPYAAATVRNLALNGPVSAVTLSSYDKNGNELTSASYDWATYSTAGRDSNGVLTSLPGASGTLLSSTQNVFTVTTAKIAGTGSETVSDDTNGYWNAASPRFLHLLANAAVTGAGYGSLAAYTYDGNANPISQALWDSNKASARPSATSLVSANSDVTGWTWDAYGNLKSETDPNGNVTQYTYDGNNLYLAQKVQALGAAVQRTFTYSWDSNLGLLTSKTDADNKVSTSYGYDSSGRLTSVTEGSGTATRETQTIYNDAARTVTVKRDQSVSADGLLRNVTSYDQLYRVTLTQEMENSSDTSGIKVQTRYVYNGSNSYKLVSNPFRAGTSSAASGEPTMGWTLTTYDQNGRAVSSQSFAGSGLPAPFGSNGASSGAVTTAYSTPNAQSTKVTDQLSNQRVSSMDGLGRLNSVTEYTGNSTYSTAYSYDVLGDLTGVNQSGQTRSFVYDSRKRLIASTNPESYSSGAPAAVGCVNGLAPYANCYYYDSNGNLTQKMDNRGVGVKYAYDALNRTLSKSYVNTSGTVNYQAIGYTYDDSSVPYSKGRLTASYTLPGTYRLASDTSITNYLGYDALGRITSSSQTTGGSTYAFSYAYNLADGIVCESYPSGRILVTGYDGANRVSQVSLGSSCSTSTRAYASNVAYAAHGEAASFVMGNGVSHGIVYNSRLQTCEIQDMLSASGGLGTSCTSAPLSGGTSLWTAALTWNPSTSNGNSFSSTGNNGNLWSATYTDSGPGSSTLQFNQAFGYDGVNRLNSATDSGGWSRAFAYDAYGNMTPSGNPAPPTVSFNSNNQIIGQNNYDQAGELLAVNGNIVTYDTEGMVSSETDGVTKALETYVYDGDGKRVEKYGPGGTPKTVFVYDAQGQLAAEYSSAANNSPCATCYLSYDHLGTARLITDASGNVISRHDYLPFGEEVAANTFGRSSQFGPGNDFINQKFTGKERDTESGLDYFGARYYGSALGRWTSPDSSADPQPIPYGILERPQTLNLYGYVENNPLSMVDDDGHSDVTFDGAAGTITVQAQVYDELGDRDPGSTFNASNNPQMALSIGKLVDGNYEFLDTSRPHHHSAEEDSHNGPYGPGGIFRLKPFTGADQKTHEGVGLHAGRAEATDLAGRSGCNYATNGCVRTTEPAITYITGLAAWDPLRFLTVTNNRKQPDPDKKDDRGDHPPPRRQNPPRPKRLIPRGNNAGGNADAGVN